MWRCCRVASVTKRDGVLATPIWTGIGFFVGAAIVVAWLSLPKQSSPHNDAELDVLARNGAGN